MNKHPFKTHHIIIMKEKDALCKRYFSVKIKRDL